MTEEGEEVEVDDMRYRCRLPSRPPTNERTNERRDRPSHKKKLMTTANDQVARLNEIADQKLESLKSRVRSGSLQEQEAVSTWLDVHTLMKYAEEGAKDTIDVVARLKALALPNTSEERKELDATIDRTTSRKEGLFRLLNTYAEMKKECESVSGKREKEILEMGRSLQI